MKTRKPWLAATFSLLCPGLGQLYNGNRPWAIGALLLSTLLSVVSAVYLFDSIQKLAVAVGLGLLVDVIFSVQAWREAKRLGAVTLRPFQRWWAYLAFAVVLYGLPDGYGLLIPQRFLSFQIPSESMVPTLVVGDRLVADGWAYWKKEPQRGDIVVFNYPRDPEIKYVKRLIGLPGDEVELRNGVLFVNQQQMPQTPVGEQDGVVELRENLGGVEHRIFRVAASAYVNFGPEKVPEGKYFMMGDNRDRSSDSRVWGFVERKEIVGRMSYIYWSWDAAKNGLRGERFGLKVR